MSYNQRHDIIRKVGYANKLHVSLNITAYAWFWRIVVSRGERVDRSSARLDN